MVADIERPFLFKISASAPVLNEIYHGMEWVCSANYVKIDSF